MGLVGGFNGAVSQVGLNEFVASTEWSYSVNPKVLPRTARQERGWKGLMRRCRQSNIREAAPCLYGPMQPNVYDFWSCGELRASGECSSSRSSQTTTYSVPAAQIFTHVCDCQAKVCVPLVSRRFLRCLHDSLLPSAFGTYRGTQADSLSERYTNSPSHVYRPIVVEYAGQVLRGQALIDRYLTDRYFIDSHFADRHLT
jgi:hypothetical protein